MFSLLLSHGAELENAKPLHAAAGIGPNKPPGERIPMMEYLVRLGYDVNEIDDTIKFGNFGQGQYGAPLQYAVVWGRFLRKRSGC